MAIVIRKFVFEKFMVYQPPKDLAVLITGCSSGFGKVFAQRLASRGIFVFATVRNESDRKSLLSISPNIFPIIVDVSDRAQLADSVQHVKSILTKNNLQLYSIVANAAVQCFGTVDSLDDDKIKEAFDVNIMSVFSLVRLYLPLLNAYNSKNGDGPKKGRIVLISSKQGIACHVPYNTVYTATKMALEGFADSIRIELSIPVVVLEPGTHQTEGSQKFADQVVKGIQNTESTSKKETYNKMLKTATKVISNAPPPSRVAEALEYGLFSIFPPARMSIGADAFLTVFTQYIPDSIVRELVQLFM
eukprot:TRINITY_DN5489_c0_g1_i1.p1 TRINITY_DN5489_c0_g1~~TRINITY_DN5489_c0_g1_i1.p1  ORF type:complete len:341 (-),score=20.47 TRINITY_DN5489_c0_g1_i1:37-945(-)